MLKMIKIDQKKLDVAIKHIEKQFENSKDYLIDPGLKKCKADYDICRWFLATHEIEEIYE